MSMKLTMKVSVPGTHRWPAAVEPVAFLSAEHRHLFVIRASVNVEQPDRAREFFMLRSDLCSALDGLYDYDEVRGYLFGDRSCETIATELLGALHLDSCSVSEDDENGATVYRDAEPIVRTPTPPPPSVTERAAPFWFGREAEGQFRGRYAAIIADVLNDAQRKLVLVEADHLFFTETCPWYCVNELVAQLTPGMTASVEVQPKDVPAALGQPFASRVSLMCRVWSAEMNALRPQDEVSFGVAYNLRTAKVDHCVVSVPYDYDGDKP